MDSIKKLQDLFAKFPTIGRRTAGRFVSYLISQPKGEIDELIKAIQELKQNVKLCSFCFQPFEAPQGKPLESPDAKLCSICADPQRNGTLLCVVEKESDLLSIENTKKYKGLYFILASVRFNELKERVSKGKFIEIIVALNPTPEGKSSSILVERELKQGLASSVQGLGFKITHLAQGLPVGGELEYADEETLESAFEGRK